MKEQKAHGTGWALVEWVAGGWFPAPPAADRVSTLAGAPRLVTACADTAQSSFHPATPESAVLGKMGAAAFKEHLFGLETISEGSQILNSLLSPKQLL